MNERKKLKNERDLEEARQRKHFERQEGLHDALHAVHLRVVKYALPAFIVLFITNILKPSHLDMAAIHDATIAVGSALFASLLSRVNKQTI
jgi:hypothetical protein